MPIQNNLGLTGFARRLTSQIAGQPHGDVKARPFRNPLLPQIDSVTITGFGADADAVSVLVTLPDGTVTTETTTRAAAVPVDDEAAAAALVVLINARAALRGHVVATNALGVLTMTYQHANVAYTTATAVVAAVATVASVQTPGGSSLVLGRFVKRGTAVGGAPAVTVPASTDTQDLLAGVILRPVAQFANAESALASANDVVPAGQMCDVAHDGEVSMLNTGSVAAAAGGVVHVVRAVTGGDEVGEARASASGVLQVATVTPGAAQNSVTVAIRVRIETGASTGYSAVLLYQTDGSMTATEVCDAFRTDLNLDAVLAPLLADTGTATLILTSTDIDTTFSIDVVEGAFTVDEATVAAARYTIPLPQSRAYWAEAAAAGAVGRVMLRM